MRNLMLRDPKILRSLQYFESVARHRSVSAAATEMSVSPSAISHQLRALTEILGEQLVVRRGRGIAVTNAGQHLQERLSSIFGEMENAVDEVVGGEVARTIRLAVCSSFGPAWLVPRLAAFHKQNPNLNLELRLYAQDPKQTYDTADVVVTAKPVALGYNSVKLFDEMLIAVAGKKATGAYRDCRQSLITTDLELENFATDWKDFARETARKLEDFSTGRWLRCSHYLLALEMAKSDLGLALVPDFLATEALDQGELVHFDERKVYSGREYQLCFKSARASDPAISALVKWMKSQVR